MRPLRLGYVALSDAAPLILAQALGYFTEEGVEVALFREASWATLRDKLAAGLIDGAHILAPLALAMTAGVGCDPTPLSVTFALEPGTAAITLQADLADRLPEGPFAHGLAELVSRRAALGASRITLASVFPLSLHEYLLRDWLSNAGVNPDVDVRLTVAAPSRAADLLRDHVIEGFCAGEPWNTLAAAALTGRIVARADDLAPGAPDKVFALVETLAAEKAAAAAIRALYRAASYAQAEDAQGSVSEILSRPAFLNVPQATIKSAMAAAAGSTAAHRPRQEDAVWLLGRMRRWGQLPADVDVLALAQQTYRPDLFEAAVR